MTDTPVSPANADDIVFDDDTPTQKLDRQADAFMADAGGKTDEAVSSVRQAVRDDASMIRDKVTDRVDVTRDAIRDNPLQATAYALGIGLIIGLLLRR